MNKTKAMAITAAGSALLAAPLLSGQAAHAAAAPHVGQAKAAQCAATASAAKSTHLAVDQVTKVAGGGRTYVYKIGSRRLTFGVPPTNFDPATATAAQLRAYGFPPRPAAGAERAAWIKAMGTLRHAITPDPSIQSAIRDNIPTAKVTEGKGVTSTSTNIWDGYISKVSSSTYYGAAQGEWIEDSIGSSSCSGATHLTWVGIGGFNSSKLLQDGTTQSNTPWFEYLGANGTGVSITPFPNSISVKSGDKMEAYDLYLNGTAYWTVDDLTTGAYTTANLSNMSSYYDGSSAEFIDERTTFSNGPSPLANFGVTDWTQAEAATSTSYKNMVPLSSLPSVYESSMINNATGHTLAVPNAEGSNGYAFQNTWKNCS
jgi:hypothetical protein